MTTSVSCGGNTLVVDHHLCCTWWVRLWRRYLGACQSDWRQSKETGATEADYGSVRTRVGSEQRLDYLLNRRSRDGFSYCVSSTGYGSLYSH